MMADIISVLVVLVFVLIVFRKRFAPLFKSRKRDEATVETAETAADPSGTAYDRVKYNVLAFDASIYENTRTLCLDISISVNNELNRVSCDGRILSVDYIEMGMLLMFLIKWQADAAESG